MWANRVAAAVFRSTASAAADVRRHRVVSQITLHWKKVVVGVAVATPAIALVQGAFLLYDFRTKHGHAPHPESPSRGVVVVRSEGDDDSTSEPVHHDSEFLWSETPDHPDHQQQPQVPSSTSSPQQHAFKHTEYERSPLRLLVIGDSLAVGVGVSRSSSPVLPASIAQALSRAMGGRAVHWTCVGVPGQTAGEIVQEIHQLDDILFVSTTSLQPSAIVQRLREWQSQQRQRASDRLESARRRTQEWLEQRKEEQRTLEEALQEPNRFVRWWKKTAFQVQNDFNGLRHVVLPDNNGVVDDYAQAERDPARVVRRQTVLDPEVVGKFDVAIVLTGLNDLKDTFLPFMMSAQRAKALRESKERAEGGLKGQLIQIIDALEGRMRRMIPTDETTPEDTRPGNSGCPENSPLVVFPALPYEPTVLSQHAPLSWFVIPLLQRIDRHKQILAELYPGRVMYVKAPDSDEISDAEAKRGAQWQDVRVLLKLDDIAKDKKERIEYLMQQHYSNWLRDANEAATDDLYEQDEFGVRIMQAVTNLPGSTMVAADGIHPSDFGYSMWGKHLASCIIKEWELRRAHLSETGLEQ